MAQTTPPDQIRKPYNPPTLCVYGDIRDFTRHTTANARGDNGGAGGGDTRTLP